jgi:hypothetical protein
MPLQNYVSLGRSGVRVSPVCLGAMTFGEDWGWGSSVEESKQILDRYIDSGATSSTQRTGTRRAIPKRLSASTSVVILRDETGS